MIQRYTFLKHPFYFVLENSSQMIAGMDKCVAVFYNESTTGVEVLSFENTINPIVIKDNEFVKSLRKTKIQALWIKESQVSFEVEPPKVDQLSFQDEEESNVLELRFLNPVDGNYDVLYFYFKNNIGNFKLSSVDEAMAITVKQVIQNLLHKQVSLLLKAHENNALIHKKIGNTLSDTGLQDQLAKLELEQFETAKSSYAYLLARLTAQEEVEFVLSQQAIRKLMLANQDLGGVEQILIASLELILNKYNPVSFYEITGSDLLLSKVNVISQTSIKQESLNKTQQFLDRYEAAAKVLLSKNQKITGLHIGEHCYPKVSPAAISDVLKKHQKKIVTLFQQYPDRWMLIKTHFKPVKNITERFVLVSQSRIGA